MTVIELLSNILKGYPGTNADALASFKPVFYARLKKHEGDALSAAYSEVFASFKPTARQPFPIPGDFEQHLPAGGLNLPKDGPSIRRALEERIERRRRVYAAWLEGQGAKIRANRPAPVASACTMLAMEIAERCGDRLILTTEQIKLCEERALSTDRVKMFGPPKGDEAMWLSQIEQVRRSWAGERVEIPKEAA